MFTPQLAMAARSGQGQSQEPETRSLSSTWTAGAKVRGPSSAGLSGTLTEELDKKQSSWTLKNLKVKLLYGVSALQTGMVPQCQPPAVLTIFFFFEKNDVYSLLNSIGFSREEFLPIFL